MSIPGSASPLFFTAAADAAAAGPIKSVRFNSDDSAYLNRTPSSAGNRKTFTLSGWIKRSSFGVQRGVFSTYAGTHPTTALVFSANDEFWFFDYNSSYNLQLITSAVFRDPSAWLHFVIAVDTTQATASNRVKIYINGEQVTDFGTSTYPSQDFELDWNSATEHNIGKHSRNFNGYFADFYFIDGQAKEATDFGAFDDNGVWQAAAYSGTFGTNGFHLFDFANESGIGDDSSGNDNDFTVNNISSTAGAGNDVLFDVPANGSADDDTGAGGEVSGNYCTWNPLNTSTYTFSNGNLEATGYGATKQMTSTIGVSSGKWYAEFTLSGSGGSTNTMIGISRGEEGNYPGQLSTSYGYIAGTGQLYNNGAAASYGATYTYGDVIGVALDLDGGTLTFYKNNSTQGQAATGLSGTYFFAARGSSGTGDKLIANWGQRAFTYTAPSGFKALCTANLPDPTIADGSDYFDAALWTGNGTSQSITGLEFSPDFVWVKGRNAANGHNLQNTISGTGKFLQSHTSSAEGSNTTKITAFNSDGFSLGSNAGVNNNNDTYVGWAWDAGSSTASNTDGDITSSVRANQTAGFSIVSYAGALSAAGSSEVGHGLNAAPSLVIVKNIDDGAEDWVVFHESLGNTAFVRLNQTNAQNTGSSMWGSTSPTSSVFTVGYSAQANISGDNHIAFCFAPVAGYSQFGEYAGNSSTDGPFVHTGFRPAFLMLKRYDATSDWIMLDSTRDTFNAAEKYLYPHSSSVEQTYDIVDFLSNGFKLRYAGGLANQTNNEYIYMCFAENPFSSNGGLAR